MGRKRIYQHYKIPHSVVFMVEAIIQDYPRRKRAIEYASVSSESASEEYIRLNKIIEAAIDQEEPMVNALLISDIINGRGYNSSEATTLASKNLYYRLKRQLVETIASNCNWL